MGVVFYKKNINYIYMYYIYTYIYIAPSFFTYKEKRFSIKGKRVVFLFLDGSVEDNFRILCELIFTTTN